MVSASTYKGNSKWVYWSKRSGKQLQHMARIPIKRFIKVNNDYRVYDAYARQYWEKREYMNAKNSIYGSNELLLLFSKQKGKCSYCQKPITQEQINKVEIHKHHLKPRSRGGEKRLSNLRLFHSECHRAIHARWTREEMAKLTDKGIDYIRLLKVISYGCSRASKTILSRSTMG